MNLRRYIGALIIVLTFLGIVYQQQNRLPNQEIVLQFRDAKVSSVETQNTLALVKKQLQSLGANNIQVKNTAEGNLIITYYSASNVNYIKKNLTEDTTLVLDYNINNQDNESSNFPIENKSTGYNLNVYEIQNRNNVDWNFVENSIQHLKSDNERLLNPNLFVFAIDSEDRVEHTFKVTYKANRNIALAIKNLFQSTPEVRAGPF
ncbi:MAG: hypothetical protein R2785_09750 [Flavobacteriaceae bacterium]